MGDGDSSVRPRKVHSYAELRIRQRRNRDNGRVGSTSAIRTREGEGDASLSTVQLRAIHMSYDDCYARQVGGALPYFTGTQTRCCPIVGSARDVEHILLAMSWLIY